MERHPKHWVLPECRGRKHQTHPQAPFSSISFPAQGKRYGRRRRVRTGLDGTSPRYSRSLFSSEPVSSFPNRKLNLRFGFYGKSATTSQSRLRRASIPTPFVPSGHFPLIGGIGPWKGSLWCVQNNKIQCKKVQSDKSRLHLLLTANIQRQLLANSIPPYQARAAGGASETTTTERAAASDVSYPLCSFLPFQTAN